MSETLLDLATTDVLLDMLGKGDLAEMHTGDPVLDALSAWVAEIDSHPVPELVGDPQEAAEDITANRGLRIAATAVVVTAMSSSGIAAAATGDPLAPFNYVATALGHLAPTDRADQIRFGIPALGSDSDSDRAGPDSAQALGQFWPQSVDGRHRVDTGIFEPKHRTAVTSGVDDALTGSYEPRHVATDATIEETPADDNAVAEVPVQTPPTEDPPPVDVPPVDEPAPPVSDPDPTPDPGGDPVVDSPTNDQSGDSGSNAGADQASGTQVETVALAADTVVASPDVQAGADGG